MGKIADSSAKPVIREYVHGAAQGSFESLAVASFLAPIANTASMVGRFAKFNQKHRFRIPRTKRALNGRAVRIGFGANYGLFEAEPNALDLPIDNLETLEDSAVDNIVMEGADMAGDIAALSHEMEVIDKAVATLGAGTAADFADANDPIKFLDQKIQDVLKAAKCGSLLRIRLLIGSTAWLILKNHPKVKGYFTGNTRRASEFVLSEEMFTEMLLTKPEVRTTYSVYDDAPEGLDEDIKFVLDSNIILFATKGKPTRFDPSFMKTFAPRGQFMISGEYETEDKRGKVVKYDWNCVPEVVNESAGLLLNVTGS